MSGAPRINRFFFACLGFALVNVAFACAQKQLLSDGFQFQNRDIGWWTVNNYRQLQKRPDVLLIGSSLMCRITNEGEATYLNKELDGNDHHRCQHMEDLLAKELGHKVLTSSLSVPGMNSSDASVVFSELVKNEKIPSVIVYGIAPRDFMDNGLEIPANTSLYQLIEKTNDLPRDVGYLSRLTRIERAKYSANLWLKKIIPLYGKQTELTVAFRRNVKNELAEVLPAPAVCDLPQFDKLSKKVLHLEPEDIDFCRVTAYDESRPNTADFKNCYLVSYNPFRPNLYRPQMKFLERFLKIAKERDIQVILVNMPLRQDSFSLMPPNLHNMYMQDAEKLATANGANFIDLQGSGFEDSDYDDQVHLTGRGASKFVEILTPKIAPYVSQALANRETKRQLSSSNKAFAAKSY